MKIDSINIKNYKSLVDIKINKPNPFTVFVGPNASGKSNILEAIEFITFNESNKMPNKTFVEFGGFTEIINKNEFQNNSDIKMNFQIELENDEKPLKLSMQFDKNGRFFPNYEILDYDKMMEMILKEKPILQMHFRIVQRLFINNYIIDRQKYQDNQKLDFYASNLEKVLKRLLKEKDEKDEIIEWLQLFIPEFENIEVSTNELSGDDSLLIYEKHTKKPFPKNLLSDGTFNILALLTAVYQSDKPQFLCIEEPENGLNPQVIKELVGFFREACEEKGHYIWLTTHSQTLVSELQPEEVIIVDKKNGETKIKQFKNLNLHGLKMDEAWLSNVLDGGLPW